MGDTLSLKTLATDYWPGLTPSKGGALAEAVAVCLESQDHSSPAQLEVRGDFSGIYEIEFSPVTDQIRRTHGDEEVATEDAAYGVSILLIYVCTEYVALERSRKGTRFDYWLTLKEDKAPYFQRRARLEVSGIRRASEAKFNARVREKIEQLNSSTVNLPGFISVVEFGQPLARVVQR